MSEAARYGKGKRTPELTILAAQNARPLSHCLGKEGSSRLSKTARNGDHLFYRPATNKYHGGELIMAKKLFLLSILMTAVLLASCTPAATPTEAPVDDGDVEPTDAVEEPVDEEATE